MRPPVRTEELHCQVYWGSHGCYNANPDHDGPCVCDCCECENHDRDGGRCVDDEGEYWCVAKPPYYGPDTKFYGRDVWRHGLPHFTGSYTCAHGIHWEEAGLRPARRDIVGAVCDCCSSLYTYDGNGDLCPLCRDSEEKPA